MVSPHDDTDIRSIKWMVIICKSWWVKYVSVCVGKTHWTREGGVR